MEWAVEICYPNNMKEFKIIKRCITAHIISVVDGGDLLFWSDGKIVAAFSRSVWLSVSIWA